MISERRPPVAPRSAGAPPPWGASVADSLRQRTAAATAVLFLLFTLEEWVWGTARIDRAITRVLSHPDTRLMDRISDLFTLLGSVEVTAGIAVVLCCALYRRLGARAALTFAAAFLFALAVEAVLKLALHHPDVPNPFSPPNAPLPANSFPSGHVLRVALLATASLLLAPRRAVRIAALLVVAAVAYTRIYAGMHWTSDVAAALLLAWTLHVAVTHVAREHPPLRVNAPVPPSRSRASPQPASPADGPSLPSRPSLQPASPADLLPSQPRPRLQPTMPADVPPSLQRRGPGG